MPAKNLHSKPFDDGTKDKLKILRDYFKEWLPVFVAKSEPRYKIVQVFDFFAGKGADAANNPGSPLILLGIVDEYKDYITTNNIKLILHFNELDKRKYNELRQRLSDVAGPFEVRVYNEEFKTLFDRLYSEMRTSANFLFLDQNGIKEITEDIFVRITLLRGTDFIFFISSSYFQRFAATDEFKRYFNFDPNEAGKSDYYHIHRKVLKHYRALIKKDYFLAPFSIKKGTNIYGLIFGTNHTLGIEKFLSVCWKIDKLTGEANFDIDNENINANRPTLFAEFNKPTKRQVFERSLADKVESGELSSNKDVYLFTLNEGFLLKDANIVLKDLKSKNKIDFSFSLISAKVHNIKEEQLIKKSNGLIKN